MDVVNLDGKPVTYTELKEIYHDIKQDKFMIYIFRGVATLVGISFLFAVCVFIHHAVKDKPARLFFGLAEINTAKTDTVYKLVQQKKDTVFKETVKYMPVASINKTSTPLIAIKRTDTVPRNQTNSSGTNAHVINGNGNSVVVNGDVVNGIKQRHLNDAVLSYILINLPDKNENIDFLFAGGKEGLIYANEIYSALMTRGYKSLHPSNWMDPNGFDKVEVKKTNGSTQLLVFPASNVQ